MATVPQAAVDESVLREHVASWNSSGTAMACSCGWEGTKAHVPTEPADREWRRHFAAAVVAAVQGPIKAEALREAAAMAIGCDHVTALTWCGICDQWRRALTDRADVEGR